MVDAIASFDDDAAAVAAITAIGTSKRDVFFATKADASVAAATRLQINLDPIDEHCFKLNKKGTAFCRPRIKALGIDAASSVRGRFRHYVDTATFAVEVNAACDQGKDGVIPSHTDI